MVLIAIISITGLGLYSLYDKLAFKPADELIAANSGRDKMEQLYMDSVGAFGDDTPGGIKHRYWETTKVLPDDPSDYAVVNVRVVLKER